MKALTVCQPFAHLIITGAKRVENRTWPTNYRSPLAIHAGKSRAWMGGMTDTEFQDEYGEAPVFGAVLGIVELIDCQHYNHIMRGDYESQYPWLAVHEHAEGPWCWVLSKPRRISPPVPIRGQMGIFDITAVMDPS